MKIFKQINTTEIFDSDGKLISKRQVEQKIIEPDEGKVLRNKCTGEIISTSVCLGTVGKIENYEEVNQEVQ